MEYKDIFISRAFSVTLKTIRHSSIIDAKKKSPCFTVFVPVQLFSKVYKGQNAVVTFCVTRFI